MIGTSASARGIETAPREWRLPHVVCLALAAVVLFGVVFWAALGKSPLGGTTVVGVVDLAFAVVANLGLGALVSGAAIEWRHPDWSRLRGADHVVLCLALACLVLTDAGVAWWLFSSAAGSLLRWLYPGVALVAMAGGAWWARPDLPLMALRGGGPRPRWALWPHHTVMAPADERWRMFTPLAVLLGAVLGMVAAVGYLGISAWHENSDVPPGQGMPAAPTGIHGSYLALGDSYSAGEGLTPFAPGSAATQCDQSSTHAYPYLLFQLLNRQDRPASFRFTACSGALIGDVLHRTRRLGGWLPPQVGGTVTPPVGLVTLTIGGNDAIFSQVVLSCLMSENCLDETFPPPGVREATARPIPPGRLLTQWGPATIEQIGNQDAVLFAALRRDFPHARIVVIGYPYLFPAGPAPDFPFFPPMCASILNRLSAAERAGIRTLQDELNNRTYEEATAADLEYVSPVAIWGGHEPCGASGQYTNSVKPYLNFPNPVNGGSFHPNAAGQQTLAALVACYLDAYRRPPDLFAPGAPHIHVVPARLVTPSQLGMVPAPGLTSVPGSGTVRGC